MSTLPTLRPIPHADERRRAAAIHDEVANLYEQQNELSHPIRQEMYAARRPLQDEYDAKLAAIEAPFRERIKQAEAGLIGRIETLEAEASALEETIGRGTRACSDDYEPYTCALTGLAVFESDDYMRDELSGDIILRDALPWPDDTALTDEEAA